MTKGWNTKVEGYAQFRVAKKLKLLKSPLRSLLFKQGNLHKKIDQLRAKLDSCQKDIDGDPHNVEIRSKEAECLKEFQDACMDEEIFLKQKSKVEWLASGDSNTAFFHSSLEARNHRCHIDMIKDAYCMMYEGDNVPNVSVEYYERFLGCE